MKTGIKTFRGCSRYRKGNLSKLFHRSNVIDNRNTPELKTNNTNLKFRSETLSVTIPFIDQSIIQRLQKLKQYLLYDTRRHLSIVHAEVSLNTIHRGARHIG